MGRRRRGATQGQAPRPGVGGSARELAKRPPLVLRYTRQLFTQDIKRAFLDELGHGLARETYAQRQFFPIGGGMRGLDRAWDQEPWSD